MDDKQNSEEKMEIISPVFRNGSPIPPQYSCLGQNVNPPLTIFNVPAGTQSLTLYVHDPDAPSGDFLHWLVWDIPPGTESIPVNSVPIGAVQGQNGAGKNSYMGPCPPQGTGTHRYMFDFYALDTTLDLPASSGLKDVLGAQEGHILQQATLMGSFTKG